MLEPEAKIYVAGHQGLVGGAMWRRLEAAGFKNLVGRSQGNWTCGIRPR